MQQHAVHTVSLILRAKHERNPVTKRTLLNIIQRRRAAVLAIDIMKGEQYV